MADTVPIETVVKHIVEVVFPDPLNVNLEEDFRKKKGKRTAGADEELEDQQATQKPHQPDRQLQQKESTRQREPPESQSGWLEGNWPPGHEEAADPVAETEANDAWQPGQPWPDDPAGE